MFSILVFFILYDAIFFWVNQTFLNQTIKKVQHSPVKVQLVGAVLCYLALTVLMYLTLSWDYAKTFLFGACVYAVYEGTNYAIFKDWPLAMVLLDTVWGGILFVLVKWSYKSLNKLF
jgi:uncharacterized membrane protein